MWSWKFLVKRVQSYILRTDFQRSDFALICVVFSLASEQKSGWRRSETNEAPGIEQRQLSQIDFIERKWDQRAIGFNQLSGGKKVGSKSSVFQKTSTIPESFIPMECDQSFCRVRKHKDRECKTTEAEPNDQNFRNAENQCTVNQRSSKRNERSRNRMSQKKTQPEKSSLWASRRTNEKPVKSQWKIFQEEK